MDSEREPTALEKNGMCGGRALKMPDQVGHDEKGTVGHDEAKSTQCEQLNGFF